jgi:hypothetical protein
MSDNLFYLQAEILQLQAENNRLKAGKFTPEELQNLCHEQQGNAESFAQGCCAYQVELFGRSPTADKIKELEAKIEQFKKDVDFSNEYGWYALVSYERDSRVRVHGQLNDTIALLREQLTGAINSRDNKIKELEATIKRLNESKFNLLPPREREPLTCNRHGDCDEAEAVFQKRNGRKPGYGFHCHNDECDECFGN